MTGTPTIASGSELVRAMADAATAEEAVERMLEAVGRRAGWALGELWLASADDDGLLRHVGDWSLPGPALLEFRAMVRRLSFPRGVGLPGRVWETGAPVWLADVADDPGFPRVEAAVRAGLHAGVGVPVVAAGGLVGVLGFFAATARAPDAGEVARLEAAARQIGVYLARVRAERRLRTSEAISGSIFEAALDCIITMDAAGRVLELNPAAEATFGYARADVRGRRLAELIIPPELQAAHERALRRYVETRRATILNRRLEMTAVRADGSALPIELTVTRLGTHEPPTFAGFVRDITARRESEEQVSAALAREHAARVQAEEAEQSARRVSEVLQRSLLPPHLPVIPGVELGAAYEAAAGGPAVGGDFYDVFPIGSGRWGVVIGDVSGKGADAASLTALARYTLRAGAMGERDPCDVLRVVNDVLVREPRENAYCTLVYACLDVSGPRPALRLAVAGHPPPLLVAPDGRARPVGRPGTLLGAVAEPALAAHDVVLGAGETLLLYTDGATETRSPGGRLGVDGLCRLIAGCPDHRPAALAARLAAALRDDADLDVGDDLALLALGPAALSPPGR